MVKLNKKLIKDYMNNTSSNATDETYSCDYINKITNYSTTEQVVGTWIDGKPIYRKVISLTTSSTADNWIDYDTGITSTVDKMISIQGTVERTSYANSVPYEESSTSYLYLTYVIGTKKITYKCGSSITEKPLIVILEYTKTTD